MEIGMKSGEGQCRRILVAEDDPATRKLLRECLNKEGFSVDEAADGLEAWAIAAKQPPDAALLDLGLPKLGGYTVLLNFRARTPTKTMPVIVVSGEPAEQHEATCRMLGAQAYLTKPVSVVEVVNALQEALGNQPERKAT